jgi:hypothetical protein
MSNRAPQRIVAALASLVLGLATLVTAFATSLAVGSIGQVSPGIAIGYSVGLGLLTLLFLWAAIGAAQYAYHR